MTTHNTRSIHRGFTLMELMVAMAITGIIVAVLVSITSTAIDTWNRSRTEMRAARQAKQMVDAMANDFESMVIRRGSTSEWLAAISEVPEVPGNAASPNAAKLVFFTAATDRYEGRIGVDEFDEGGDVSCVGYQLQWRDPVNNNLANPYETFVLKRMLVDPDVTFADLLGKADENRGLEDVFFQDLRERNSRDEPLDINENRYFLCENIFQFTLVFHVETTVEDDEGNLQKQVKLVTISTDADASQEFRIRGNGLEVEPPASDAILSAALESGDLMAVEISLTVITEAGINQLRNDSQPSEEEKYAKWLAKNTYHYSKLVQLPRM